jgi:hypothetical protein
LTLSLQGGHSRQADVQQIDAHSVEGLLTGCHAIGLSHRHQYHISMQMQH